MLIDTDKLTIFKVQSSGGHKKDNPMNVLEHTVYFDKQLNTERVEMMKN